jgi:hypothetical protein
MAGVQARPIAGSSHGVDYKRAISVFRGGGSRSSVNGSSEPKTQQPVHGRGRWGPRQCGALRPGRQPLRHCRWRDKQHRWRNRIRARTTVTST